MDNPSQIERDIEITRQNIGRTLDALHDKLSIRQRMRGAMENAQESGKHFAANAGQWVKAHPGIVTALVAAPLLLLTMKAMRSRRSW